MDKPKQLVDWSSAFWAGLIAGIVFLLANLFWLPQLMGGNAWVVIRLFASILLGSDVLAPPATMHVGALIAGLMTHFTLSLLYACMIAFLIHRWGLITGMFLGMVIGAAIYVVNIYTVSLLFPWFFTMRHTGFLITHLLFGLVAGGVYETLEVEEFEKLPTTK